MDERIFQAVEKNKRLIFLLFLLIASLIAGIASVVKAVKLELLEEENFPASILSPEFSEETVYQKPSFEGIRISCPSEDYELEVPGKIIQNHANRLISYYENGFYTMYEGKENLSEALNSRFASYFVDSIDIPESGFELSLADEGYLNGYKAEYQTGILQIKTKMYSYTYYVAAYGIDTGEDNAILYMVSCETREELFKGKKVLDEIIFSMTSASENKEENVKEEQEINIQNNMLSAKDEEHIRQENGVTYYEKEFTVYVGEEYKEGAYIVFKWINYTESPVSMTVTSPSGLVYQKDEALSEDGQWVFVILDNEIGIYTIRGECTDTIYVNYYEAMNKEDYYAIYKNTDLTTGEPVRSFKEEKE